MRWSLHVRFLLMLIVLLVVIFGAITLVIVKQDSTTLRDNLITKSKSFAALATQPIGSAFVIYQNSGTIKIAGEISSFTDLDYDISSVTIIDTTGRQLFSTGQSSAVAVSQDAAASLDPTYLHDKSGNLTAIVQPYVETYGIHTYDVVYGVSYQSVNQSIQNIVASLLALSVGIMLVSLVAWYFLINRLFLRPVARISQIALLISKGDLDRQINLKRSDEIGDLAVALDTMANSLKADIAKLKQTDELKSEFLMIISHNLRTPLTVVKGYLDNITSSKTPDKDFRRHLEAISANVSRLGHFSEDALTISSMEGGQATLERTPLELAPMIQEIAVEFSALAKQKNLKFSSDAAVTAWIQASPAYFRTALWNLLDNAYKFTPEGGTVALKVAAGASELVISVQDNGIGIAASEVPKLFTKFHRATDIMHYDYEGIGLGLYLSKLIVEQDGGRVSVETAEGTGSTFTIHLPVVAAPAA